MHDRSGWIIAHGVDPAAWAARYGLEAFTHPCYRCNAPCTASLPFASGALRGLVAPLCPCGHPTPPYCIISTAGGDVSDLFPPPLAPMGPSHPEFDEAVRRWHESDSDEPLHEWLGLSWDEYARLVKSPVEQGPPASR